MHLEPQTSEDAQSQTKVLEWKTGLLSTWFFLILLLLSFPAHVGLAKPPDQEVEVHQAPGRFAEGFLECQRESSLGLYNPERGQVEACTWL